jgi:hypothetical protein
MAAWKPPCAVALLCTLACDTPTDADAVDAIEALDRRVRLRDVPGRHADVWDAMFDLDEARARELLASHITADATVTFVLPAEAGGDQTFPPGPDGWIALVTGSGAAGGWVPAAPGYPRALHMQGSVHVLEESATSALLQTYVRASHYETTTEVDTSEAVLVFDLVHDDAAGIWRVAHLDLTPLSLRDEGGQALPPLTP